MSRKRTFAQANEPESEEINPLPLEEEQTECLPNRKYIRAKYSLKEHGLEKYWKQRYDLFSKFDEGIKLDAESWYSVTPEKIAESQAQDLKCETIVDAFCGCGGNTIQFAKTCQRVIAIDIDPVKIEYAKHNAEIYGVADKIEFIVGDFLQLSASGRIQVDDDKETFVYMSPPWGGPSYNLSSNYDLDNLLPVGAKELMTYARKISSNVALYLPRNSNRQQIIDLAGFGKSCRIVKHHLGLRFVAISAYYGSYSKL